MRTKPVSADRKKPTPVAVTLTLDMDAPSMPAKPVRRASVPAKPVVVSLPSVQAPLKKPAPKPQGAADKPAPPTKAMSAKPAPPTKAMSAKPAPPTKAVSAKPAPPTKAVSAKPTPKAKASVAGKRAKAEVVRIERAMALHGGLLWRMSGRHAVAYVQNAALACALLAVENRQLARCAMAVYYNKKGRATAWQVRFDAGRWDDVARQLE